MHQTTFIQPAAVARRWHHASAKGKLLGPLAVKIATTLMGRHRADWSPTVDSGDFVVVTDVEGIVVTGKKATNKTYKFHSGYMGGITEIPFNVMQARHPERILQLAVKRMLPKSIQGRHQLKRLKVFKGAAHPHTAQAPKPL